MNLRSGTWDWQAYLDHFPRAQTSGPLAPAYPWTRTNDPSLPMLASSTSDAFYCTHSGPQHADLSSFHAGNGLPHCGRAASWTRTRTTTNHGTRTSTGRVVKLDSSHFGIRLIPKQAKASTSSRPTGRADSPARGVPRKLAGRSPGAASRHPSGTLLCLHVTKTGSDGQELTPLLPLDATRSSTCRRLGYIVTKGPAKTRDPPIVHQQPTAVCNRARIRPNPCSHRAELIRRPGARWPHGSPATANSLVQPFRLTLHHDPPLLLSGRAWARTAQNFKF